VRTFPLERVEVQREDGDERLALAGLHLRDLPLVEHDPTHGLHIEMPQLDAPPSRFARNGKGFDQQIVERLAVLQALPELLGLRFQLIGGELLHHRLELVDVGDLLEVALDLSRVRIA